MQAVVEHSVKEGILGTHYFLQLKIRFTPTELAVIQRRELDEVIVVEGARKPIGTRHQIIFILMSRYVPLVMLIPLVSWWFGFFVHEFPYILLSFLVAVWIAGSVLGNMLCRKTDPDPVFVEEFLRGWPVRLYTATPYHSKILVPEVYEKLEHLKIVIDASADLGPPEIFEF